jgi:hypothetical protein
VRPENLQALLEEGVLSRLEPEILHSFVANRSDYKSARLDRLFQGMGMLVEEPTEPTNVWERGFETAVGAVNETFGEVGDAVLKILS